MSSTPINADYLIRLQDYLTEHYPGCLLMPSWPPKGKQPICEHKNGQWSADHFKKNVYRCFYRGCGCVIILSDDIIVVDIDNKDEVDRIEAMFPMFKDVVCCETLKGRHYYFKRSPEAIMIKDMPRGLRCPETGNKLAIDIKTMTSTGTGGLISIPPSPDKKWKKALGIHALESLPLEFIDYFKRSIEYTQKSKKISKKTTKKEGAAGTSQDKANLETSEQLPLQPPPTNHEPLTDETRDRVENLMVMLSLERVDNYPDWIAVGWALHNINVSLLPVWDRWSRLSKIKYKEGECEHLWSTMRDEGYTMGSLCEWVRQDTSTTLISSCKPSQVVEESRKSQVVVEMLKSNVPSFSDVIDGTFSACEKGLRFSLSNGSSGIIDRKTYNVILDDGSYVGNLLPTFQIRGLNTLHPCIEPSRSFDGRVENSMETVLTSENVPKTIVRLFRSDEGSINMAYVNVDKMQQKVIENGGKLSKLDDRIQNACQALFDKMLGEKSDNLFTMNVLNINGEINIHLPETERRHNERSLVQALLKERPEIQERVRFEPDAKVGNCNGMFVCDENTNIWHKMHNAVLEEKLLKVFEELKLNKDDMYHLSTRRGRNDMLYALAPLVVDVDILSKLDANMNLFAMENGVFEFLQTQTDVMVNPVGLATEGREGSTGTFKFRAIEPTDYVSITSGWNYDSSLARQHRPALERFVEQLFPLQDERKVVLSYFASLLRGKRLARKFLVLTDKRHGSNGKSTFCKLMMKFFGSHSICSTKFVCKSNFEGGRDSHGAGTETLKGKRLLVAEELKHNMKLDVAMLKKFTGGTDVVVEDRKFGRGDYYKFIWQAGLVLVFNEGDCPSFDSGDQAFIGRMIVAPMRSKFVDYEVTPENEEEYMYRMDMNADSMFDKWFSSLADVLIESYDPHSLDESRIPPSMREWSSGLVSENNVISSWLDERVTITNNPKDYVSLTDIHTEYKSSGSTYMSRDEFKRCCKAYILSMTSSATEARATFHEMDKVIDEEGKRKTMRNLFKFVVFNPCEGEEDVVQSI